MPEKGLDVALVAVGGLGLADSPAQALGLDKAADGAGGAVAVVEATTRR